MKASDICVGDWFKAVDYNSPFRINAIYDDVVQTQANYQSEIDGNWYSEAYIKDLVPIELTEDILVKNGFTYNKEQTESDIQSVYHHFTKFYDFPLGRGFYIEHDTDDDIYWITDHCWIKVNYVHQLQHLLRLCGIEKEIEL